MTTNKRMERLLNDPLLNRKIKVGIFFQPITVTNPQTGQTVTLDALVDTGATITSLPGSILHSIGVDPAERWTFQIADGSDIDEDVGHVLVTVEGRTTPTVASFAPEGSTPLLGVVVVETVGFTVDPVNRRLIRAVRPRRRS